MWKIPPEDVLWDEVSLSVGVPDLRGVAKEPRVAWDGQEVGFQPGAGDVDLFCTGMHVAVPSLRPGGKALHTFSFELTLAGSEALAFVPVGKETEVSLASTWRDPSFTGAFLPSERTVDERGFRATWKVSYFARSFPQRWQRGAPAAATLQKQTEVSAFGLRLLDPVDFYRQSDRAVKYAALFVLLTFLTFALFEVLQPLRIHPVQYLLVGFAMCLFYLILLAASEQVGFALAYGVGAGATIALVAGYATRVLAGRRRGGVMGALLAGLYGYLYVLLQLEDYALLLGTVGLFAILATVMWVTRDLDWYAVDLGGARVAGP
ncbi:MAG TPA: cell envelope integrity protein CreD [Verrucomicrobiae bacterium]|nr:cell envelope integrity protein CreD [Verrucomicrobiae bacterium]